MIKQLPNTTTAKVNKELVKLRETGGAVALGRVLTLIVVTDLANLEEPIKAANKASKEHPCRVIVIAAGATTATPQLDAEIRVGGDAGASEVVVLKCLGPQSDDLDTLVTPLLLPDAPIVTWWASDAPDVPAAEELGKIAQRRITDALVNANPLKSLERLRKGHAAGDTDLSWTRLTTWRGILASALDQPPFLPVKKAVVTGNLEHPSVMLMGAWLSLMLGCPVVMQSNPAVKALSGVVLERECGEVSIVRPGAESATVTMPGDLEQRITLPHRTDWDCLAEDLRRLDPDDVYGDVLRHGFKSLKVASA